MAATDSTIIHPDDMVDFGEYKVMLKNGDRFKATFIKFCRRPLDGKFQLYLSFDNPSSGRGWVINWGSIKYIKLISLPDDYEEYTISD